MKVITEERLREWQNTNGVYKELFQKLIEECQELDTLTVDRLLPMCEAPITDEGMRQVKKILAWHICEQMFIPIWVFADGGAMTEGESFNIKEFEGFIPMPRYEPENV